MTDQNIPVAQDEDEVAEDPSKSPWPFDRLPEAVREWLRSVTVENIITRLYEQYGDTAVDPAGVPRCLTRLALLKMPPSQFIPTLITEFATTPEAARAMTVLVVEKILKPIEQPLREKLGIKIEEVTGVAVVARVTELSRPLVTDVRKPQSPAAPQKPTPPPTPRAPAPTVISTEKPVGLSEVTPTPSVPTTVQPYKDEHPVVE